MKRYINVFLIFLFLIFILFGEISSAWYEGITLDFFYSQDFESNINNINITATNTDYYGDTYTFNFQSEEEYPLAFEIVVPILQEPEIGFISNTSNKHLSYGGFIGNEFNKWRIRGSILYTSIRYKFYDEVNMAWHGDPGMAVQSGTKSDFIEPGENVVLILNGEKPILNLQFKATRPIWEGLNFTFGMNYNTGSEMELNKKYEAEGVSGTTWDLTNVLSDSGVPQSVKIESGIDFNFGIAWIF